MKILIKVFKAVANEKRIKILEMLHKKKSGSLPQVEKLLNVSKPTACRHLKILEYAGLIKTKRDKTKICFSINSKRVLRFNREVLKMLGRQRNR